MKVRTGFVSNSSSSSFCIYGAFIERGGLDMEAIKAQKAAKPADELDEELEEDYDDDDYEFYEARSSEFGLEAHSFDGSDGYYVGVSWSSIGDDETGKQFKERVEKALAGFCGKPVECETCEEAYYS